MLVLVAGLYVGVRPWLLDHVGPAGLAVAVVGGCTGLGLAVATWQSRRRRYLCPACGARFAVSLWHHLIGQNWFGRLRTRCPACGQKHWCESVPATDG